MWRELERSLDKFLATNPSREDLIAWLRSQLSARILHEDMPQLDVDDLTALIRSTPIE